jgi:hypothetical protein
MADFIDHDYETGVSLATLGYTSITDLAVSNTDGLTGSTWGVRGTGTLNQRSNARADLNTGMTANTFLIEFDLDHVDVANSTRSTIILYKGTIPGAFLTLDSDLGDGRIELYSHETPGFGTVTPVWTSAAGLVVAGVSKRWSICGQMGTGVGVADGSVTFKIDGVVQTTQTVVQFSSTTNAVTRIRPAPHGRFDNLLVSDDGCLSPSIQSYIFGRGAAADDRAKVTSDLTVLMNLDELGRTVHEPNTLYVAGNLIVTGDTTIDGDVVTSSETLMNSIVTTGSEIVLDSDGNVVFVNGS